MMPPSTASPIPSAPGFLRPSQPAMFNSWTWRRRGRKIATSAAPSPSGHWIPPRNLPQEGLPGVSGRGFTDLEGGIPGGGPGMSRSPACG